MKGNKLAGLFLILFGVLYLSMQILAEMDIVLFHFWDLWPLFTITFALILEYSYFRSKRSPGVLIPGGILMVIGLLHLFESITNWHFSAYTWPLYTFAVFVGFFHYWLVTKDQWSLIVALILLAVFIFLVFIVLSMIFNGIITVNMGLSVLLIVVGSIVLFTNKRRH